MDLPLLRSRGTLLKKPNNKYVKCIVQGRDFYKIPILVVQATAATKKKYNQEVVERRANDAEIYNVSSRDIFCRA